jgi:hypothetical protein
VLARRGERDHDGEGAHGETVGEVGRKYNSLVGG